MKADGLAIELPDNPLPYITEWLMEAGPLAATGMGPAPLGWAEIDAWAALTGTDPNPWEARTIRRLSRDFHDQMDKAREPTCPAPFVERPANDDAVTAQFKAMFARMSANKKARERTGKKGK